MTVFMAAHHHHPTTCERKDKMIIKTSNNNHCARCRMLGRHHRLHRKKMFKRLRVIPNDKVAWLAIIVDSNHLLYFFTDTANQLESEVGWKMGADCEDLHLKFLFFKLNISSQFKWSLIFLKQFMHFILWLLDTKSWFASLNEPVIYCARCWFFSLTYDVVWAMKKNAINLTTTHMKLKSHLFSSSSYFF